MVLILLQHVLSFHLCCFFAVVVVIVTQKSLESDKISHPIQFNVEAKKRTWSILWECEYNTHQWRNRKCNTKSLATLFFRSENDTHSQISHSHSHTNICNFCLFRSESMYSAMIVWYYRWRIRFRERKKNLASTLLFSKRSYRYELLHHLIGAKPNSAKQYTLVVLCVNFENPVWDCRK